MNKKQKETLINILIILGIIALGLFAVNQYISFHYKNVLVADPCGVCLDLNPQLKECFESPLTRTPKWFNLTP